MIEQAGQAINRLLRRGGLEVHRFRRDQSFEFRSNAEAIELRHRAQTVENVEELRKKYESPVFGDVRVWDLVERLAQCVDPADCMLFGASQQMHVLQILEAMARDGVDDPDLVLTALLHDLGKLLLLTDEDPANLVGLNTPVGHFDDGAGLDNCVLQWNHDDLGYERFKDHVSDRVAWLIRYHSMDLGACERLMDDRDRAHAEHLRVFTAYDHQTKSPFGLPKLRITAFRELIEESFPDPIPF